MEGFISPREAFQIGCSNWLAQKGPLRRSEDFSLIVVAALLLFRETDIAIKLATEFEIAESTVHRWADGTAKPHPLIQKQVVENLLLRAKHE